MEVTPEMYAWLSSQKVIDPFKSFESEFAESDSFKIPLKTLELLSGGKYMDLILKSLQESYNNLYNLSLNYIENLNQMKEIDEEEDYIINSVKYFNWNLIKESLKNFGLNYNDEIINNIINGDKESLMQILNEIYELHNEVLKHIQLGNHSFDPNKYIEEKNENDINESEINNSKIINNKNKVETINLNILDPNQNYDLCKSILEFFIISLCKNFKLTPRQSVALLSNNRKYLSILCNKGTKGSFEEVINWLNDLDININIIINLLKKSTDGINISYAIVGTSLCSKNEDVVLKCINVLNKFEENINFDWDWLNKEGIDSFIFAILKHDNLKLNLLNSLFNQVKNNLNDFFNYLRKKMINDEKKQIYEFYSSILPILKNISDKNFYQLLQNFLFEICFNEKEDLSYNISILGDAFFYFFPLEEDITNKILEYFSSCIKSEKENIFSTSISQIFCLMERFGEVKIEYAPILYKNIVFLLIENFDNEIKREFILINFEKFLNNHQTVPIDILLEDYINKLNNCDNYSFCDLNFIFNIIEHPRISSNHLILIIQFLLKISLNNIRFIEIIKKILTIIFEKELINNTCNENEIISLIKIFSDHIKASLDLFTSNIEDNNTKILEIPFDLLVKNFENLNENVQNNIIDSVNKYRKEKKKHSKALLSLLWFYDNHDDILLQLEEIYKPFYEKIEIIKKKEAEKKDDNNYIFKNQKLLSEISEKRKKKEEEKKKLENKKNKLSLETNNNSAGNIIRKKNINNTVSQATENIKKKKDLINKLTEIRDNEKSDDIFKKHGRVIFPEKKIKIQHLENDINKLEKIKSIEQLIYPEGTIIKDSKFLRAKSSYFRNNINDNFFNPINLKDEENREIKAIEGYNLQYKKNINFYFRTYSNEKTQTISKTNLLRMLRDRGYNKYRINLDELNLTLKDLLIDYLKEVEIEYHSLPNLDYLDIDLQIKNKIKLLEMGELDLNFFKKIMVKLSFIMYHKVRDNLTISECYGLFLERLTLAVQSDITANLYEKYKPAIKLIKEKRKENKKYNLPPGFKIIKKEKVEYNKQLPLNFIKSIGENNYICYEILNDLIYNIFNSTSIESYVQINNEEDIEIDFLKIHKWNIDLTLAYINLNSNLKKEGIEVCDILEEKLNLLCKGKDNFGNKILNPIEKNKKEITKLYIKDDKNKEEERKKRNEELKLLIEENKKKKKEKDNLEIEEKKK